MRKIRLNLDALTVESFPTTTDARAARGTVRGHSGLGGCNTIGCGDTVYFTNEGCQIDPSISADGNCICQNNLNNSLESDC